MPWLELTLREPTFWLAVSKVVWIDVLLSGDNALVIAMACRSLPARQRFWGIILGALCAVLLRIGATGAVSTLMTLPYLKVVGGLALIFVAIKMCIPDDEDNEIKSSDKLFAAIRIIVIADIVMSVDNMVAVAAVAQGNVLLLAIGLAVSIPLVVTGATLIAMVLNKFPILIWAGAALLGWIAGELIASEAFVTTLGIDSRVWSLQAMVLVLGVSYLWSKWREHELAR